MKVDLKKIFVDPFVTKKIKVPSVKNIMALREAGNYEKFKNLMSEQNDKIFKNSKNVIVPAIIGIFGLGAAVVGYAKAVNENVLYLDESELLINESIVDNEIENKGDNNND